MGFISLRVKKFLQYFAGKFVREVEINKIEDVNDQ